MSMMRFNPHNLDQHGLTPDDPFAPRNYPSDPAADDGRRYRCAMVGCKGHQDKADQCSEDDDEGLW